MTDSASNKPLLRKCGWFIGIFNAAFICLLLFHHGSHAAFQTADDLLQVAGGVFAAALCYIGAKPKRWKEIDFRNFSKHEWMALLCCLGMASYAGGQICWSYAELICHNTTLFPSSADIFYLISYPLLLLAFLASPSRPLQITSRARILLDGLIIMTAAVTFSWFFILGPTLHEGSLAPLAKAVATAYPLGDLLLVFCVLLLGARPGDSDQRFIVKMIWIGLGVVVATDSIQGWRTINGMQISGGIFDVGWSLGYMPVGLAIGWSRLLAAQAERRQKSENAAPEIATIVDYTDTNIWQALTPYALLPCVLLLVIYAETNAKTHMYAGGVYIGAILLIALVLFRQILAIAENRELNSRLQVTQSELRANVDALTSANERLQSLATTDLLTDLPNQRGLINVLNAELERAERYDRTCTVLFCDVDHFKALNDTCGHTAGDASLREFAKIIRKCLRRVDTLGRWGGEEFLVILPETSKQEALIAAEHMRAAISEHKFAMAGGAQLTCSLGVATFPPDASDRDALVDAADRAMYVAKRLGRNQVRHASDPAVMAVMSASLDRDSREEAALIGTVEALATLVEVRDSYTGEHTSEVGALAERLAARLGMSRLEIRTVGLAGRLHDIGKIAIPDAVLRKPESLSENEWEIMRTHTCVATDVISRVPALRALVPMVRGHHESWDGTGYPDRLAGVAIPLGARIIAVADTYCAMTTDRPYRARCSGEDAIVELSAFAGIQFDPDIVAALAELLDEQSNLEFAPLLQAA